MSDFAQPMGKKESFSLKSDQYAQYRPSYPRELFAYLNSICSQHQKALDCATGNGQAALSLTEYFSEVVAIDMSQEQLENAIKHPKINYRVSTVETLELPAEYFDLITVAQALHWFNLPKFYEQVRRLAKPGAILAVWCYDFFRVSPEIDQVIAKYILEPLDSYWSAERQLIADGYRTLDFPFLEISPPSFVIENNWSLEHLLNYIKTWSAFKLSQKTDLIENCLPELVKAWGIDRPQRSVLMDLYLRVGRV